MSNYYNRQWRLPNAWNGTESNVNKQSNYSMDFDGTEYIDTNFVPADNLTLDFSVSAWINMAALSNNTDATVLGTYQFTNGRSRFFFRIYLTGGVYKYFFGLGPDSNYIQDSSVAISNFSVNTWVHLAVTYDGTNVKLYSNGTLDGTLSFSGTNNTYPPVGTGFDGNSYIGATNKTGTPSIQSEFTGKIDAVAIYNYALSLSQITTLYGSSSTGIGNPMSLSPKPVAYYPLGDQDAFNGAEYLTPNSSLKDYVFDLTGTQNTGQYVDISSYTGLSGVSAFTVSIWFQAHSFTLDYIFGISILPNWWENAIGLYAHSNELRANVAFANQSAGITNQSINLNEWYHAAITFDGSTGIATMYINKTAYAGTNNLGSTTPSFDTNLTIGAFPTGSTSDGKQYHFDGLLSNMTVFNAALPATGSNSIETLYNNGSPLTSMSGFTSLQGWWKLDASATYDSSTTTWSIPDSSSNSNTGTSSGMTQANLVQSDLSFTTSYSPYSFDFDGATDYIRILPFGTGMNLSDSWSVSIWINTTTTLGNKGILTSRNASTPYDFFSFGPKTKSNGKIETWLEGIGYTELTPVINDGNWHHLTFAYDHSSTTIKVYTDNSESYSSTSYDNGTGRVLETIGAAYTSWYWIGKLSNLSVWNKQLSSTEVSEIYSEGIPQNLLNHSAVSSLVSWWQLGSNSSFNTNWTVLNEISTGSNGTSVGMMEDDIVDGVGSYANGLSSGMGGDEVIGDAPYSTANALSVNMDVLDRVTDTPS